MAAADDAVGVETQDPYPAAVIAEDEIFHGLDEFGRVIHLRVQVAADDIQRAPGLPGHLHRGHAVFLPGFDRDGVLGAPQYAIIETGHTWSRSCQVCVRTS